MVSEMFVGARTVGVFLLVQQWLVRWFLVKWRSMQWLSVRLEPVRHLSARWLLSRYDVSWCSNGWCHGCRCDDLCWDGVIQHHHQSRQFWDKLIPHHNGSPCRCWGGWKNKTHGEKIVAPMPIVRVRGWIICIWFTSRGINLQFAFFEGKTSNKPSLRKVKPPNNKGHTSLIYYLWKQLAYLLAKVGT